jgi:hypothetical protein
MNANILAMLFRPARYEIESWIRLLEPTYGYGIRRRPHVPALQLEQSQSALTPGLSRLWQTITMQLHH